MIWFYHYGVWPTSKIDHRNTVKSDNDIDNLREATNQQNSFNTKSRKNSTSKYKGVYWCKRDKKWISAFMVDGKASSVGRFKDESWAGQANNEWWNGVCIKRNISNGNYDLEFVSMERLEKDYS